MTDTMAEVNEIIAADLPEVDKLVRAFGCIADMYLTHGQREIDLLRALEDHEGLVRVQIRLSTMEHCRSILQRCYQMVTARRKCDGHDEL